MGSLCKNSRLSEILGVEEDEEFIVDGDTSVIYRVHKGFREVKGVNDKYWYRCFNEAKLLRLINGEAEIKKYIKPTAYDAETIEQFRALVTLGLYYVAIDISSEDRNKKAYAYEVKPQYKKEPNWGGWLNNAPARWLRVYNLENKIPVTDKVIDLQEEIKKYEANIGTNT